MECHGHDADPEARRDFLASVPRRGVAAHGVGGGKPRCSCCSYLHRLSSCRSHALGESFPPVRAWIRPALSVAGFFRLRAEESRQRRGPTRRVLEGYYEGYDKSGQRDESAAYYPPLQDGDRVYLFSRLSILGLPVVCIVLWMVILGSLMVRTSWAN